MDVLSDFDTSVRRSLTEIDPKWEKYPGLIVCGTHSPNNVEEQILRVKEAREKKLPFLGICHGHQIAAVEYARNVLGVKNATSEEWVHYDSPAGRQSTFIVVKLPTLKVGLHGGESYWNNYEVIDGFSEVWKKADSFITCQYHPEYNSSVKNQHPLLVTFLQHAKMAS
jgi:CTP synthase (UTP-ammonia lyase)